MKNLVIECLEELKEDNGLEFEINEELILVGNGAALDSFDFVNLTVLLEEKITDELDKTVTLVNEKAFSRKNSPFKNIESLTIYLEELLGDN